MDNGTGDQLKQFSQLFQGIVKPKTFVRKSQPVLFKHMTIGDPQNDKHFSRLKVWVHKPSLEYPSVGIFFGLSNGAGSAYAKVNAEDLTSVIQNLTQWVQDIAKIYPELEKQQQQADQMTKMWDTIQKMSQTSASDDDFIPENDEISVEAGD